MRCLAYPFDLGRCNEAGARNGFAEPRDRAPKIAAIATPRSAETARPSFEPRKSRQIGAYSSETGNRQFVQECVVVEAFQIKPVSKQIPCLTGKLTGNFANSGPPGRF